MRSGILIVSAESPRRHVTPMPNAESLENVNHSLSCGTKTRSSSMLLLKSPNAGLMPSARRGWQVQAASESQIHEKPHSTRSTRLFGSRTRITVSEPNTAHLLSPVPTQKRLLFTNPVEIEKHQPHYRVSTPPGVHLSLTFIASQDGRAYHVVKRQKID